jgi:histidine phosphotransferase ChpT
MAVAFNLRLVQLLNARICHDLAGPIGAISNGLELMCEMGAAEDGENEALDLVRISAKQVSDRLMFMRVAFGLATGMVRTLRDARSLLTPAVIGERTKLIWPEAETGLPWGYGDQSVKLLLIMIELAGGCLIRGGDVEVFVEGGDGTVELTVTAQGAGVRMDEGVLAAMAALEPNDALTPRTVHGYFAAQLARAQQGELTADYPEPEMIAFRARIRVPVTAGA